MGLQADDHHLRVLRSRHRTTLSISSLSETLPGESTSWNESKRSYPDSAGHVSPDVVRLVLVVAQPPGLIAVRAREAFSSGCLPLAIDSL
jgi:hypothetical protein